jgi:peptide/nickel transport system permease protein
MHKNISKYIYMTIIFVLIISSIFAEEISGRSPYTVEFSGASVPGKNHLLGTDFLGRDILSRTLIGGRVSIVIGVIARSGSVLLGLVAGLLMGLSGKSVRSMLNGITDIFIAIPSLLLAMGLAVSMGEGIHIIVIAIIAGTWAPVARFVSTKVLEIKNHEYVDSAKVIGAGRFRIVLLYIIPELLPILLPVLTTGIASSIMLESTLSFLGLAGKGLNSHPSWGLMIQEGSRYIFDAPWIIIPPSLILTILILCFNALGDRFHANK